MGDRMRLGNDTYFAVFAWLMLATGSCFAQQAAPSDSFKPPQGTIAPKQFATPPSDWPYIPPVPGTSVRIGDKVYSYDGRFYTVADAPPGVTPGELTPGMLRVEYKSDRKACAPSTPIIRLAWDRCMSKDPSVAIKACTDVIVSGEADKDCLSEAYFRRGTAQAQTKNNDLAVADLSDAVDIDWYYIAAYVNRGIALDGQGLTQAAEQDYAAALAMSPNDDLATRAQEKAKELSTRAGPRVASAEDLIVAPGYAGTWQSDPFQQEEPFGAARERPAAPTPHARALAANIKPYELVKVFYATNRQRTASDKPNDAFGGDRGDLTYGMCEVSIPFTHTLGGLEGPGFMQSEDPTRHVMLQKVTSLAHDDFLTGVRQRMAETSGRKALLYIHGFNTSFRDAARRTGQLQHDLAFDGAAVFYSWPSQASALSYVMDSTNAEWAAWDLRRFIVDFTASADVDKLFIIAHSMGTHLLTTALTQAFSETPDLERKIAAVVLAAPDIDAAVFKRDLAPRLVVAGTNVVLYTSNSDNALWASRQLHGYVRAGDSSRGALIVNGVDTVDATGIDTSKLGHSYYAETKPVLSDIADLIKSGNRAAQRAGLSVRDLPSGRYWEILAATAAINPPP